MVRGLFEECLDIDRLVTEVSDGLDPSGVLLPQVLEVLICRLVVGVVHLDGPGVNQLRGEVLDLGGEVEKVLRPLLVLGVGEGDNVGSLGQSAGEGLETLTPLLHQLPLPLDRFLREDRVRELLERAGDVSEVLDDPVDDGIIDGGLQLVDAPRERLSRLSEVRTTVPLHLRGSSQDPVPHLVLELVADLVAQLEHLRDDLAGQLTVHRVSAQHCVKLLNHLVECHLRQIQSRNSVCDPSGTI